MLNDAQKLVMVWCLFEPLLGKVDLSGLVLSGPPSRPALMVYDLGRDLITAHPVVKDSFYSW